MTGLRRTVAQVLAGMSAVIGLAAVRRVLRERRRPAGSGSPLSRRARRAERSRALADARWARNNLDVVRTFLNTSESASTQLSSWDNARRTGAAYLHAGEVVQSRLAAARASGSTADQDALETKLRGVRADAQPQLHAAATALAELDRLQTSLQEQLRHLRADDAPRALVASASELVATHEIARQAEPGDLDERRARQRLDHLSSVRDVIEHLGIRPG